MSSILSAQNLHTLRRRNIGRRCPCCLSPAFLSPRPRPPPAPVPDRPCPNGILDLPSIKTIVVGVLVIGSASLARLTHRRQAAFHAAAFRFGLTFGARPIDDFLLCVDPHHHVADHLVEHFQPSI